VIFSVIAKLVKAIAIAVIVIVEVVIHICEKNEMDISNTNNSDEIVSIAIIVIFF
jgi:hypothetical protein